MRPCIVTLEYGRLVSFTGREVVIYSRGEMRFFVRNYWQRNCGLEFQSSVRSLFIVILSLSEWPGRFCFLSYLEFSACNFRSFCCRSKLCRRRMGLRTMRLSSDSSVQFGHVIEILGKMKHKNVRVDNTEQLSYEILTFTIVLLWKVLKLVIVRANVSVRVELICIPCWRKFLGGIKRNSVCRMISDAS